VALAFPTEVAAVRRLKVVHGIDAEQSFREFPS
jgi:hypothetical protein